MDRNKIVCSSSAEAMSRINMRGWCIHAVCIAGGGSMTYRKHRVGFEANDLLIIPYPELVEGLTFSQGTAIEFMAAPVSYLNSLLPANNYGISGRVSLWQNPVVRATPADAAVMRADLRAIAARLATDASRPFRRQAIDALVTVLIYDLFAFHMLSNGGDTVNESEASIVQRFVADLDSGLPRTMRSVSAYASRISVTAKYLSAAVKRATGLTASQMITQRALSMIADSLSNTNLTASQIAAEMNFASVSYFSRYVLKHWGETPSSFRRRLGGGGSEGFGQHDGTK